MKRTQKGYITCYLALTLGVMFSLIFILLEAIRMETIKTETEGVMDIALFSVFGEYHKELLNQYDLFFIDSSYGEQSPKIQRSEEHLQYYMNENFEKERITGWLGFRDLTALHCDNVTFENYIYASDKQGQVLMYQILKYMKNKTGLAIVEEKLSSFKDAVNSGFSKNIDVIWQETEEELDRLVEKRKKDFIDSETGEEISVGFDNPIDTIEEIKAQGTLGLALPKEKKISAMVITPEYYISHRNKHMGKGEPKPEENIIGKATEKLWLEEYLLEKCSTYQNSMEKAVLKYQIEYLLYGKSSDFDNLEAVVEDILQIRQCINLAYLISDTKKTEEADAMATVISAVLMSPEIKELLKATILFAWNYAESVKDVRILLEGNKLPLWKNEENWNTPLSQMLTFSSHLEDYRISQEGMEYQDYLRFFLSLKEKEEILYRFMDICEMDIRITEGNQYFQMDGCIYGIRAKANVSSQYGHGYEITREYVYE